MYARRKCHTSCGAGIEARLECREIETQGCTTLPSASFLLLFFIFSCFLPFRIAYAVYCSSNVSAITKLRFYPNFNAEGGTIYLCALIGGLKKLAYWKENLIGCESIRPRRKYSPSLLYQFLACKLKRGLRKIFLSRHGPSSNVFLNVFLSIRKLN